jgi:hypothetical protein
MHKGGVTDNGVGEVIANDIILRSWIGVGNEEIRNVILVKLMPHMKHTCSCTALERIFLESFPFASLGFFLVLLINKLIRLRSDISITV